MKRLLQMGLGGLLVMSFLGVAVAEGPVDAKRTATLDNLMTAFNGESNAQAKYTEFAKKAKAEGYLKVAKLFEAAALSEGIHAAHHAKAIKALKGTPKVTLVPATIGTTKENLEAALAGETAEIENMYPEFVKQAEAEKQTAAARSFNGAKKIEAIHADWFKKALANLNQWKADGDFYTCKDCGYVADKLNFDYCPVCKAPKSEFVKAL